MEAADGSATARHWVTSVEAVEQGYKLPSDPPAPQVCQFCHSEKPARGVLSPFEPRTVAFWSKEPQDCDCPESEALRAAEGAELARVEEAEEAARRRAKFELRLKDSRIRRRFLTRTFETFEVTPDNKRGHDWARRYADQFDTLRNEHRNGLYLTGAEGRGKTHLAVATALHLLDRGYRVTVYMTLDLLGDIKATFNGGAESEERVMQRLRDVDLLVLDDLGKEPPKDWALSTLFRVINDRYEDMTPIIVTTQYDDDELVARLSKFGDVKTAKALVSRLSEMCYRVDCQGKDWR